MGRLEQLHDGLGEFSLQVASRLAARHVELREQHGIQLHFHLPPERVGLLGSEVSYLTSKSHHRHFHFRSEAFDLWHSLHQLVKFRPPFGTHRHLLTLHDLNYLYGPAPRGAIRMHRRNRSLMAGIDALATISRYTAEDARRHLDWKREIHVVYNGSTDLRGVEQVRPPTLRFERFFFHLSRMAPTKNPQSILALAALRADWQFVLAGPSGPDVDAVEHAAKAGGLSNVQVLKSISVPEKAWLFANCRAFLFPSLTEGFGLPPIEAMYLGCPVFLSDRTSLPEVGGDVARYFRTFEPETMAAQIECELPHLSTPVARERRQTHAAHFTWDRCVQSYIDLYLTLLAASS